MKVLRISEPMQLEARDPALTQELINQFYSTVERLAKAGIEVDVPRNMPGVDKIVLLNPEVVKLGVEADRMIPATYQAGESRDRRYIELSELAKYGICVNQSLAFQRASE